MLAKAAFIVAALTVSVSAASGQPKSDYTRSSGPSEICGITADSASDFRRQVSKSKKHKLTNKTDRFEVYEADDRAQWVFTRPGDPAHPFATCRRLIEKDGALYMDREVTCG